MGTDHGAGIDLLQYLAMRLSYEAAFVPEPPDAQAAETPRPATPTARDRAAHLLTVWNTGVVAEAELSTAARILAALPVAAREMVWQQAFESHYRTICSPL